MTHIIKLIVFIAIALVSNSCAFHKGLYSPYTNFESNTKVEFTDIAIGYSKVSYFLGFGGLGKDALVNEAKRNLFLSYPLRTNQTFENFTVDFKTTIVWPYRKLEVLVIADVVNRDSSINISYSKNYVNILTKNNNVSIDSFRVAESVAFLYDNKLQQAKIIKLSKSLAYLSFVSNNGTIKIKKVKLKDLFNIGDKAANNFSHNFVIGDKVQYKNVNSSGSYDVKTGTICGLNNKMALIVRENKLLKVRIRSLTIIK